MMETVVAASKQSATVREYTVGLLGRLRNNDLDGQVEIITDFVKENVTYVRDPDDSEYLVAPEKMLSDYQATGFMVGDCDDHVMLLNAMLGSVGFQTKCVGVKFGESATFNHVVSGVIMIDGHLALIDPCAKSTKQPQYKEILTV